MTDQITHPLSRKEAVEKVAEAIHDAKLKLAYDWGGEYDYRRREPWELKNAASPKQTWHEFAYAQAQAALTAINIKFKGE